MTLGIVLIALMLALTDSVFGSMANCPKVECPATIKDNCTKPGNIWTPNPTDPDTDQPTDRLITSKGYPAEVHKVTTSDGYILTLFRIPHGKNNTGGGPRPVIYLQHGFMSSSDDWVINFPQNSWGFILADKGYDVWMGNVRGNTYSQNHTTLNPMTDFKFWDFCIDDYIKYDLKGSIDYILNTTGQTKLSYMGHSMGTTMIFGLLSSLTEYNAKIKFAATLAPIISVKCSDDGLAQASQLGPILTPIRNTPILQKSLANDLLQTLCGVSLLTAFCRAAATDPCSNATRYSVYTGNHPAGTSTKTLQHWTQIGTAPDSMHMFDYLNPAENTAKYGVPEPPLYDVSKITAPIGLYHSCGDTVADLEDVSYLASKLSPSTLVIKYTVQTKDFVHSDFVLTPDAGAGDLLTEVMNSVAQVGKRYHWLKG